MSTATTNFGLGKAVDADNAEVYLTVTLPAALDLIDTNLRTVTGGFTVLTGGLSVVAGAINFGTAVAANAGLSVTAGATAVGILSASGLISGSAGLTITAGTINYGAPPAFVAGDRYLVIDASGNIHKSAIGPAS